MVPGADHAWSLEQVGVPTTSVVTATVPLKSIYGHL